MDKELEKFNNIVFFDSNCLFCHAGVRFLIKMDSSAKLKFTSTSDNSIKFWHNQSYYYRSSAIIRILYTLGGVYKLCGLLLFLIPKFLRDWAYNVISKQRHRLTLFKTACPMPQEEVLKRILK